MGHKACLEVTENRTLALLGFESQIVQPAAWALNGIRHPVFFF